MSTTSEQRLIELATRLWQAIESALLKLPSDTQAVLKMRVEDGDVRWALSLVLAAWRLSDKREAGAAEVEAILKETGATTIVQQITSLQMLLPDSFGLFVNTARNADADYKIAGAAAHLTNTFKDLVEAQRNALHTWLRGVQFLEVSRALIRRFPMPGSGRPPVWGAPPPASVSPTTSKTTRSDRFDRADSTTPRTPRAETLVAVERAVLPKAAPPPRLPTSALDKKTIARAYLVTLGWKGTEIDRLMSGPSTSTGKSGT